LTIAPKQTNLLGDANRRKTNGIPEIGWRFTSEWGGQILAVPFVEEVSKVRVFFRYTVLEWTRTF
jgi:hypothetical protein